MPAEAGRLLRVFRFGPNDRSVIAGVLNSNGGQPEAVSVDIFDRSVAPVDRAQLTTAVSNDQTLALSAKNGIDPGLLKDAPPPQNTVDVVKLSRGRLVLTNLLDHSKKQLLSSTNEAVSSPQFSADGKSAYAMLRSGGIEKLVEFRLSDSTPKTLYSGILANREFVVNSDGVSMVLLEDGKFFRFDQNTNTKTAIPVFTQPVADDRPQTPVYITGASVFVGNGDSVLHDHDVLITNGRIEEVGDDLSSHPMVKGAHAIDAGGRFLMAGLVDAHAHVSLQDVFRLPDIVRSGITSVIDPGAAYVRKTERLEAIDLGIVDGPNVYSFSDLVMGVGSTVTLSSYASFIEDRDVSRELTSRYARLGYAGMKIYSTASPEVSRAIIKQAHDEGLLVIGHLGSTTWIEAVEAGIDSLTHMMPFLCDSRFESAGNRFRSFSPPDRECLSTLFDQMALNGTTFDPNIVKHSPFLTSSPKYKAVKSRHPGYPYRAEYVAHSDVLLDAISREVNVVIGRDEWDHSLVFEMEAYEAIGVPRFQILQMVTRNAAVFLKEEDDFGTVEAGKRADLIVVDGDPLERIGSLRDIVLVMKRGQLVVDRLSNE